MIWGLDGRQPIVSVDGVGKAFGGIQALEAVSLVLCAGEVLGIIGPNGAGKSTLINVVTGLYAPSEGTVLFDGDDVTSASLAKRARLGLVRSFQSTRTFGSLTVVEALRLAADAPRPRSLRVDRSEVQNTLEEFGLAPYATRGASELPYGVQKVLNLALVAICRPRALFLDEPFAGVGRDDVARLSSVIEQLRSREVALAVVEHNIEALLRLADRVTVLDSGRTIFNGTPTEARSSEAVRVAYLGQGAAAKGTRR
jgi:ABC-type branched-subunit amino acid transport system ATPase component